MKLPAASRGATCSADVALATQGRVSGAAKRNCAVALHQGHCAMSPGNGRLILVPAHRRENFGEPLEQICLALHDLAGTYQDDVQIVYPVHHNPNVQEPVRRMLGKVSGITLTDLLDYLPLVYLMKHSTLVLTDSGGLQEEAPGLGKPVLVLRAKRRRRIVRQLMDGQTCYDVRSANDEVRLLFPQILIAVE